LFDKCKVAFFGRMVNAAARRAGYEGHDDAEVDRRGKEALFGEAIARLLERQVVVIWDDQGEILALHPTHREPLHVGGPPYVPGSEYWRNQREQALTELRTQLIQLRDQSFDASLRKTAKVYAQQIRRGQLAADAREEALVSLIALTDVLLSPSRLAHLLGVAEADLVAAWQKRLQPAGLPVPPNQRRRRHQDKSGTTDPTSREPDLTADSTTPSVPPEPASIAGEQLDGTALRRERQARQMTLEALGDLVGVSRSTVGEWERGKRPVDVNSMRRLLDVFAERPVSNGVD
jgi:DNA-binding transcriptional regulator YiaG